MCYYAHVYYSCGCQGKDEKWCKPPKQKIMTKLWDNCNESSSVRTGLQKEPIYRRRKCRTCRKMAGASVSKQGS